MRRLSLALALTCLVACSTSEFAPDAIISTPDGGEIAVRSWEFCGPDSSGTPTCLDSVPSDDLPVLTVPGNGWWSIDRPAGYTWEISYLVDELGEYSPVLFLGERQTGRRFTEIPQPGTYLVEMTGRTDETVGAWTFELVISG